MDKTLDYWKKRCELAERVLLGRTTTFKEEDKETMEAYREWSVFGNELRLDIPDVELISDTFSLGSELGEINNPCTDEERELAIKFMDETILRKDNSKGFTFGYRVHESEVYIPSRLREPDEAVIHSEGLKIDENGTFQQIKLEDRFPNPDMNTDLKGFHENFLKPEVELDPKMSFTEFAKAYFPDNEISEHHKAVIEKLEEVAGTPNHLIMQGIRPINWYKDISLMRHALEAVRNGEKCAVATHNPDNYTKQMKSFFNADVELKELSENVYSIKLQNLRANGKTHKY